MVALKKQRSVFLIGPMGAGKTTIGRCLAGSLRLEFCDADHEIEKRTGATIPLIFAVEGEAGFRQRERNIIAELSRLPGLVLATGGGAVLDPDNREWLSKRGYGVYLYASVDQQLKRTVQDRNRPLLQTEDPRGRLQELMQIRDPLYRAIAEMIVQTDGRTVCSVVSEIINRLDVPGSKWVCPD
jgi:shikimate kinase